MNVVKVYKKLLLSFFLFFVLFNPPFYKGISFTIIAVVFSVVAVVLDIRYFTRNIISKEQIQAVWMSIFFLTYAVIMGMAALTVHMQGRIIVMNVIRCAGVNICMFLTAFLIAGLAVKNNYSVQELIDAYIYCGVIQAVISMVSYVSTDVSDYLNAVMVSNIRHENIASLVYNSKGVRCYGFAANLFDTFGCAMSMIAILALAAALSGRKMFLIYFGVITFSAVINSRTSMVLISAGIFVLLIQKIRKKMSAKMLVRILFFFTAFFAVVFLFFIYIGNNTSSMSAEWIKSGADAIVSLILHQSVDQEFRGANTNYFAIAFDRFFFLPDNLLSVLFGTGMLPGEVAGEVAGRGSDVAYIRHIWQFGITGSLIQYSMYIFVIWKSRRMWKNIYKGLPVCLGVMLFVYLIKNEGLGYGMPTLIVMPVLFTAFSWKKAWKGKNIWKTEYSG